jgi:hypothetical protein
MAELLCPIRVLLVSPRVGCLGPVMAVEVVVAAARLPSHLALEQILAGLHQQRLDLLLPATTIIPFLKYKIESVP